MKAYILDKEFNEIGGPFVIKNDDDLDYLEIAAKDDYVNFCIRFDRSEDGQSGYWTPSGASFEPHWYAERVAS